MNDNVDTEVEVTGADIANGVYLEPCSCPLALALSRAIGRTISVGAHWFGPVANDGRSPLSWDALEFVRKYDGRKEIQPTVFTISVPSHWFKKSV